MQLMNVYLNTLSRYAGKGKSLGYMEDFWGIQEERCRVAEEAVQRRALEKHTARTAIWGRTLQMKWYAYTAASYLGMYNGNWFNPRYDLTTMRYCAPGLAVVKRKLELVDWVLTHSSIVAAKLGILQPSATMRIERPERRTFHDIVGLHQLLYGNGQVYELVPEEYFESGKARLAEFGAVILPRAEYMSADLQNKLAQFAKTGGTLIIIGRPGAHDEIARESGLLLNELRGACDPDAWAEAERLWNESGALEKGNPPEGAPHVVVKCGEGRVVAWEPMREVKAGTGQPEILKLIADAAPRAARTRNNRLEVVLRITETGERYLFALNPDPDNPAADTVLLAQPAGTAVDVTVAGGFPVKVSSTREGAAFHIRLGPAEFAAIHLGR